MQVITRGQNTTLVFTLTERVTLTSPYFLVRMVSRTGRNEKRFILPSNLSSYKDRYDKFTITETSGTEVLTSGTVTLTPTGEWDYEIYQQASSTNTTVASAGTLLETGMVRVIGTDRAYTTYDSQNKNYTTYGNGST